MAQSTGARVLLVTDPAFGDDLIVDRIVAAARTLPPGWLGVQLRAKSRPAPSRRVFAWRLRAVTRRVGASLVINGDACMARDVGADGVHLPAGAGSVAAARAVIDRRAWVSVAAHSDEDVRTAVEGGADAVLVSPVFDSRPASMGGAAKTGRGLGCLRAARAVARGRVAVYALGGVDGENARSCFDAGADGVAVIRALLGAAEPTRVARAIHDAAALRC